MHIYNIPKIPFIYYNYYNLSLKFHINIILYENNIFNECTSDNNLLIIFNDNLD